MPGLNYTEDEDPTGLPVITNENGVVKYVYVRRTDAFPFLAYFTELSTDGINFETTEPSRVRTLQ